MNILMISRKYLPWVGGLENFLDGFSNELVNHGHKVYLIATKTKLKNEDSIQKYRVIRIPSLTLPAKPFGLIKSFNFWFINYIFWPFFILYYIKKLKPDIIHAHNVIPSGFAGLSGKLLHIPLIVTSHGSDILIQRNISHGARLNVFNSAIIKFVLKFVDKHIVVSEYMTYYAHKAGSSLERVNVIPNFINLKDIITDDDDKILHKFNLTQKKYCLYLGRFDPVKNVLSMIKSLSQFLKSNNDMKLVIAGYGQEEEKYKKFVKKNSLDTSVIFTGVVLGKDKWVLYKNALAYIIASTREAFGITTLEAMASGTLVIALNTNPFCEYIINNKNGILIDDLSELPKIIGSIKNNDNLVRLLSQTGKKTVREYFTVETITQQYVKLYETMIRAGARATYSKKKLNHSDMNKKLGLSRIQRVAKFINNTTNYFINAI